VSVTDFGPSHKTVKLREERGG